MTMVGFMVTLVKAGLVFGLLALTVKMLRRYDRRSLGSSGRRRRRSGGAGAGRRAGSSPSWGRSRRGEAVIDVVERAALGRNAAMVLVRVQEQHFVLGVTDAKVAMLLEVDIPTDDDDDEDDEIDLRVPGMPGGRAVLIGTELLRQARRRLPGGTQVESIDPAGLTPEDVR